MSAKRLESLPIPAAVAAQMWRCTTVCCLRRCTGARSDTSLLSSSDSSGFKAAGRRSPASLSLRSPPTEEANEVIFGLPLGACAARRDPSLEALDRGLKWVVALANTPSLVGLLHRHLSMPVGAAQWVDSTPALAAALASIGWSLVRNACELPSGRLWTPSLRIRAMLSYTLALVSSSRWRSVDRRLRGHGRWCSSVAGLVWGTASMS